MRKGREERGEERGGGRGRGKGEEEREQAIQEQGNNCHIKQKNLHHKKDTYLWEQGSFAKS